MIIQFRYSIIILVFVSMYSVASEEKEWGYEDWIQQKIAINDEVLCKKEKNGNYYIFSKNSDGYKAGSFINITSDNNKPPLKYSTSWQVKNSKGMHITTKRKDQVKDDNDKIVLWNGEYYSDSVHYISLNLDEVDSFKVILHLGLNDKKDYLVEEICEVAVILDGKITLVNKVIPKFKTSFPSPKHPRLVGLIYPDDDSTNFLKAVLDSMKLTYSEKSTNNGQYIEWKSDDESQVLEIQNRVSQYTFIKELCKGRELPLPSRPALSKLTCKE